jgi:hypothetical protein
MKVEITRNDSTNTNNKYSISIATSPKMGCAKSIVSEDSVNLEELINNNFTTDMEQETDLPDLANLNLDDSKDDFWTLEKVWKTRENLKLVLTYFFFF